MSIVIRSVQLAMVALALALPAPAYAQPAAADPLPSWNDGATKEAIIDFVTRVTTAGGRDSVPPAERIATINNDGTLWCEQPIERLAYLRANRFKSFIVSGGGVDFIRGYAEKTYGIPPEQVIGSSAKTQFELRDGKAVLIKLPELNSIEDKQGKPININLKIGPGPILAFGNSDGDLEMLQYTAAGMGPRLMLLLHHDDAGRDTPTTGSRSSAGSKRPGTKRRSKAGGEHEARLQDRFRLREVIENTTLHDQTLAAHASASCSSEGGAIALHRFS